MKHLKFGSAGEKAQPALTEKQEARDRIKTEIAEFEKNGGIIKKLQNGEMATKRKRKWKPHAIK